MHVWTFPNIFGKRIIRHKNTQQDTTTRCKCEMWNVTCEENAHKSNEHICKHGKCVCATKSLQWKLSTRDIPLECLSPWGFERSLSLIINHLSYPYNSTPIVVCHQNKPIKLWGTYINQSKLRTIAPFLLRETLILDHWPECHNFVTRVCEPERIHITTTKI